MPARRKHVFGSRTTKTSTEYASSSLQGWSCPRAIEPGFHRAARWAIVPGMIPSLTDTLCTRCALCCDGSLFADVELSGPKEATGLEILGLKIEDDGEGGRLLSQPCAAVRGKRCGIYAHRPESCRTFECRLLQDVQRGAVSVERAGEHIADALDRIGRVKRLLAQL